MQSDHWYHELFRALPDLVRHLLPESAANLDAPPTAVTTATSANSAYTFQSVVLKKQIGRAHV